LPKNLLLPKDSMIASLAAFCRDFFTFNIIRGIELYKFAAASDNDPLVFGSARPGYSKEQVNEWIKFMQNQGIQRICCLLPATQLTHYADLLGIYHQVFGTERVCWAPIEDFEVINPEILTHQILPFLVVAQQYNEKVLVHCSGGIGRTGQVLAAWLIAGRGFSPVLAITTITKNGRNPYEAVIAAPFKGRNPWKVAGAINTLLAKCDRIKGIDRSGSH
jgi:protein-tyrosine phosphatase